MTFPLFELGNISQREEEEGGEEGGGRKEEEGGGGEEFANVPWFIFHRVTPFRLPGVRIASPPAAAAVRLPHARGTFATPQHFSYSILTLFCLPYLPPTSTPHTYTLRTHCLPATCLLRRTPACPSAATALPAPPAPDRFRADDGSWTWRFNGTGRGRRCDAVENRLDGGGAWTSGRRRDDFRCRSSGPLFFHRVSSQSYGAQTRRKAASRVNGVLVASATGGRRADGRRLAGRGAGCHSPASRHYACARPLPLRHDGSAPLASSPRTTFLCGIGCDAVRLRGLRTICHGWTQLSSPTALLSPQHPHIHNCGHVTAS
ncbi:hypothetical protein NPIL_236161 [Nephila pilipes]|uniref:Uncharacterized protein n=1 Tax=Nephila pilipes TaxID=299642 RepID=A0A8X6NAW2_NEPPI|nr:hypothetical protein NPIL_236161 [Nephila pilipes]